MSTNSWDFKLISDSPEIWTKLIDEAVKKDEPKFLGTNGEIIKIFSSRDAMLSETGYKSVPLHTFIKGFNEISGQIKVNPDLKIVEQRMKSNLNIIISEIVKNCIAKTTIKEQQEYLSEHLGDSNWADILSICGIEVTTKLINVHASFDKKDGLTPFLWNAALNDQTEVVDLLLKLGANPHSTNKEGESLISHLLCIEKIHLEIFRKLLDVKVNYIESTNLSFHDYEEKCWGIAANRHPEYLELMLNRNISLKKEKTTISPSSAKFIEDSILSAFIHAFLFNKSKSLEFFTKAGITINSITENGKSLLSHLAGNLSEEFAPDKINVEVVSQIKKALAHGANPFVSQQTMDDMLIYAIHTDDMELIKNLMKKGSNLNYVNSVGFSALTLAIKLGKRSVTVLLLEGLKEYCEKIEKETGKKISFTSPAMVEAINKAIRQDDTAILKLFIGCGVINLNSQDKKGKTPLIFAATQNNLEAIQLLIEAGVELNIWNNKNESALLIVQSRLNRGKGNFKTKLIYDLLWESGAKNEFGSNILIKAMKAGNISLVEKILFQSKPRKIDVNAMNMGTFSPLSFIAFNKDLPQITLAAIADILLKAGANPNIPISDSKTTDVMRIAKFGSPEIMQVLVRYKIDLEKKDAEGFTPLMHVCKRIGDNVLLLRELLKVKPNLDTQDNYERTALQLAEENNNREVIAELLKLGARDRIGATPLLRAITNNEPMKVIDELIGNTLLDDEEDYAGRNIAHFAAYMDRSDILEKLAEKKFDFTQLSHENKTPLKIALELIPPRTKAINFFLGEGVGEYFISIKSDVFEISHALLHTPEQAIKFLKDNEAPETVLLSIPFLLKDRELAIIVIKSLTKEQIQSALEFIEKKYPETPLTWLKELNLRINSKHFQIESVKEIPKIKTSINLNDLLLMYDKINITEATSPGYCEISQLKDDGVLRTFEELRTSLSNFVTTIQAHKPFFGSPPEPLPTDLEPIRTSKLLAINNYFTTLENLVKNIIVELKDTSIDPNQKTSALLDLAIAGNHCGARFMSESRAWVETLSNGGKPLLIKDTIDQTLSNYRIGILEKISHRQITQTGERVPIGNRAHTYNQYLSFIGKSRGLPGFDTVFEDHAFWLPDITPDIVLIEEGVKKIIPGTASINFDVHYNPTAIIDRVMELSKELGVSDTFFMWIKDNMVPELWEKDVYEINAKKLKDQIIKKQKEIESFSKFDVDSAILIEIQKNLKNYGFTTLSEIPDAKQLEEIISEIMKKPRYSGLYEEGKVKMENQIRAFVKPFISSNDKDRLQSLKEFNTKKILIENAITTKLDLGDIKEISEAIDIQMEWNRREAYLDHEESGNPIRNKSDGKINRDFITKMLIQMEFLFFCDS